MSALLVLAAVVVVGAFVALLDWRRALFIAIVIGIVQDPIRKVTPGAPVVLVLSALPVWMAIWFVVIVHGGAWGRFQRAFPDLSRAISFFCILSVPAVLSTFRYGLGAWRLALLGAAAYGAPLLTLVVGLAFPRTPADLRRLLGFYILCSSIAAVGMVIEAWNLLPGWPVIGTEALGAGATGWIRFTPDGRMFQLVSGFYRSPDIAAWHAAALVILGLTLANSRPLFGRLWLLPVAWGSLCLLISGRRKGIIMPFVWAAFMLGSYLRARRGGAIVAAGVLLLVLGTGMYFASGEVSVQQDYISYAASTIADAPERFVGGTWEQVIDTFSQAGFFGNGIGSATQGAQYIVGDQKGWQESGPSKILAELGVPGTAGALLLLLALLRAGRRSSEEAAQAGPDANMALGLYGLAAANLASFGISHQTYSDFLVLNLSTFLLGAALAAPRWAPNRAPTVPGAQVVAGFAVPRRGRLSRA